jgi:[citrate (pro-3S)-lyase] ligase
VEYAGNWRGLNMVIFDAETETVLDSVCFDTHIPTFSCARYDDILENIFSKLSSIFAAGFTVPQYLFENNIVNCVIYTEEEFWAITEQIYLQFQRDTRVELKNIFSKKPFRKNVIFDQIYLPFQSKPFLISDICSDDVIIVLKIDNDSEFESSIKSNVYGCQVILPFYLLDKMYHWAFYTRPFIDFKRRHPNVTIITFKDPPMPLFDQMSDNELDIINKEITYLKIYHSLEKGEIITGSYKDFDYTIKDLMDILATTPRYKDPNGAFRLEDYQSNCLNIRDGHRVTVGQPNDYKRAIYFVGGCNVYGLGSSDKGTIPSELQRLMNSFVPDKKIKIENYGSFLVGVQENMFKILNNISVKDGDIIIANYNYGTSFWI